MSDFTYTLIAATEPCTVLRSDGASIPPDLANSDYANYLAWKAEGNTPTPYTPPPADYRGQAQEILNQATLQRIQRAVIAGRATWATPDVVTYCAYLDALQPIATGRVSGPLPAPPPYPAGT